MKITSLISSIVIVFILIGETFFRDSFHMIWLVLSLLFFLFLGVYHWMDKRKMFLPNKMNRKDKES